MKDRIKLVRKEEGMSQAEFGSVLGVEQTTVGAYEHGRRTPSDSVVMHICSKFGVCENWLRTGKGPMRSPIGRRQEIYDFISLALSGEPNNFKERLITALVQLSSDDWELLERIAKKIAKKED